LHPSKSGGIKNAPVSPEPNTKENCFFKRRWRGSSNEKRSSPFWKEKKDKKPTLVKKGMGALSLKR